MHNNDLNALNPSTEGKNGWNFNHDLELGLAHYNIYIQAKYTHL